MIQEHQHHTKWSRRRSGSIADRSWFALDQGERHRSLEEYDWVEFKCPLDDAPPLLDMHAAGFALADVLIGFRIRLADVPEPASGDILQCAAASEEPFRIRACELQPFAAERFQQLPGIDARLVTQRYAAWGTDLIRDNPNWCLRLSAEGRTVGWFLAEPGSGGLYLALSMLSSHAPASGMLLYQCALREYCRRGVSIGHAGFSVRNTNVLNIYAALGARFTTRTGVWFWHRSSWKGSPGEPPSC
jgi:hypothetical protein